MVSHVAIVMAIETNAYVAAVTDEEDSLSESLFTRE